MRVAILLLFASGAFAQTTVVNGWGGGGATGFTAGAGTLTGPATSGVALIDATYKALASGPVCNTTTTGVPSICSGAANVNVQTGTSYTLVASDNGKVVTLNNASAITLTVPASLGAGFNCLIVQLGAGAVTPTASSTTINQRQSLTKTAGQYAVATLVAYAADVFALGGDLQ